MLEQDPRIIEGPTFFSSLYGWMKRVAIEVNSLWSGLASGLAGKVNRAGDTMTGGLNLVSPSTSATEASSDNSTRIATTAWCKAGFAALLSANGYLKLPSWLGGFVIQWSTIATTAANTAVTWTYPLAFPNACIGAFAVTQSGTGGGYFSYIGPPGSLTSNYVGCSFPGAANSSCLAIGY